LRPDLNAPITGEVLNEMVYTRQVVKEVLRFRPPAPMVPQVLHPSCHPPAPTSCPDDMCTALSGDESACSNGRLFPCHALAPLWTLTAKALNNFQSDSWLT